MHVPCSTGPKQTCFAASDVNSRVWRDSRVILSNQKSVFTQHAGTFIYCKIPFNVGGKTCNIALQHGAKQVARFSFPFYRSFRVALELKLRTRYVIPLLDYH